MGILESDTEAIASSKLGTGASGSENNPDTSQSRTKAAKIEAIFRLLFIILDLFDLFAHQRINRWDCIPSRGAQSRSQTDITLPNTGFEGAILLSLGRHDM